MSAFCVDGGCDIQAISADVAKLYGKPVLQIVAYVDEEYLKNLSPFGAVSFKDCAVRYTRKAKKWHMAHEIAHVYQCRYKMMLPQYQDCKKPREMDAMMRTSEWCKTHDCPANSVAYIKEKAGCE